MNLQLPPQIPMLGQREASLRMGIQQALHELSLAIYTSTASHHISDREDQLKPLKTLTLQSLAKHSMAAAKTYFQALGIAQFDDLHSPTTNSPQQSTNTELTNSSPLRQSTNAQGG